METFAKHLSSLHAPVQVWLSSSCISSCISPPLLLRHTHFTGNNLQTQVITYKNIFQQMCHIESETHKQNKKNLKCQHQLDFYHRSVIITNWSELIRVKYRHKMEHFCFAEQQSVHVTSSCKWVEKKNRWTRSQMISRNWDSWCWFQKRTGSRFPSLLACDLYRVCSRPHHKDCIKQGFERDHWLIHFDFHELLVFTVPKCEDQGCKDTHLAGFDCGCSERRGCFPCRLV